MRYISINENESLKVDDDIGSEIIRMKVEEPDLPINFDNGVLSFQDYTVGTIQIGDVVIEICPRNPAFTLETMFEMLLYESINNFEENYNSVGFGDNQSFGITSVASQFYYECMRLLDYGLTGDFVSNESCGKDIKGPIVLEKFNSRTIAVDGVYYRNDEYTTDIGANQIIKSAILKVLQMEKRPEEKRRYQLLLREFSNVSEYKGNIYAIDDIANTFYSANRQYPIVLEFAIKILKDMKIKYNNGQMSWYAFLHNSNDIFEKYVRKVISRGIEAYVTKWENPKQIAVLDNANKRGYKSYVPDILIDYNPLDNSSKAVLDAKNKLFRPEKGELGDVLSSADMYQMAFYCDKQKTKLGGLVYPAEKDYTPVVVLIDGSTDFRFVLFGINMKERISLRHRRLCENIKRYLLYYMQ